MQLEERKRRGIGEKGGEKVTGKAYQSVERKFYHHE